MKKTILTLVSVCLILLSFSGCSQIPNVNNADQTVMQKHVIELTMDNYETYFDVSSSTDYRQTSYTFTGCLSYAFYEDVTITFEYYNSSVSYTDEYKEQTTITLNAAGNGFCSPSNKYQNCIVAISGRVIYWI